MFGYKKIKEKIYKLNSKIDDTEYTIYRIAEIISKMIDTETELQKIINKQKQ